jgi:hypothetical protein
VYDNVNFKDTVRDEALGHTAVMRNLTTAAIVICPEIPDSGLQQSMHDGTKDLDIRDIFNAPAISGDDNGIGVRISTYLISEAIQKVHGSAINAIFNGPSLSPETEAASTIPIMPEIDRIATHKTEFWQFGVINENEGTIAGTYGVHDSIFLNQLGLEAPETPIPDDPNDDFRSRLWLTHGDQLTAHHIRTVKSEQTSAARPYDRRNWLLGVPAWFHVQMNLLNTTVRTHFECPGKQKTHHSIKTDIGAWGRSAMHPNKPKFHLLEPIVVQGYAARVLALFYTAMQRRGYLTDLRDVSLEQRKHIDAIINALDPATYLQLIDDVRCTAFTLNAWKGLDSTGEPIEDIEFRTMCRMLQEVELFMTVRHAVKHGDIGLLRRVVDPLIIHFLGASQYNYAYEMLFYRWNLTSVNTPELQRAILASGLVNWPGKSASNKAIDLGLEHLNGSCKIEMKCYKNSTHDVNLIFDRVCLSNTWVRALRAKLEETFGEFMRGDHTSRSTDKEIFSLARTLVVGDLSAPRRVEDLPVRLQMFDSEDILRLGMDRLAEKVMYFNDHYVYRTGIGTRMPDSESNEIDVDTAEYANVLDDRFDIFVNPNTDSLLIPIDGDED